MVDLRHTIVKAAVYLTLCLQIAEAKTTEAKCPIGFTLAVDKDYEDDNICYSLIHSTWESRFDECAGNLFTMSRYNNLKFPSSDDLLTRWTDYKSLYPGGPFVDWSYDSPNIGDILDTTYEVKRNPSLSIEEQLCVVMDPFNNFTAVRCSEMHYRYCFVPPYSKDSDACDDWSDGTKFWSPLPTCLLSLEASDGSGKLRTNWNRSQESCKRKGGSLVGRGWRYSNKFVSPTSVDQDMLYPLNVVVDSERSTLRYGYDNAEIPQKERYFENSTSINGVNIYGAINKNNFWDLVDSSYVFHNVICEKPVTLKHVNLTVSMNSKDKLTLTVNDTSLDKDDIVCFTDAIKYHPSPVNIQSLTSDTYIVPAKQDGYYWCIHTDTKNFYVSESNKFLYVKVKESTQNLYAVRIHSLQAYSMDNISKSLDKWKNRLEEYVYYSSKYLEIYNESDLYNNYTIMNFRKEHPGLPFKELKDRNDIILNVNLKRLYLDAKTVIIHVKLHPNMQPVRPGQWEKIVIEYMKPVYYCDKDKDLSLGNSYEDRNSCKIYTCTTGDYNLGVQTIITKSDLCYLPASTVRTAVYISDVTPLMPVAPPLGDPPDIKVSTTRELQQDGGSSDSSEENLTLKPEAPIITIYPEVETTTVEASYEVSTYTNEVLTVNTPTKPTRPTTPPPTQPPTIVPVLPPTRPPPEEQLDQVISNLQGLLNGTDPVLVEDISETFTQVDEILDLEVNITGNLLHLLDRLGNRLDLDGALDKSAVRDNIALLVADAQPNQPVRGLRVAATDYNNTFTNQTFEIIREDINSTQLAADESEAVVSLPLSVSNSKRRVSFVIFRNDRAFAAHDMMAVNSRILSVNVENITDFYEGDVIDIHFRPSSDPERNQSRACAYWKFNEDDSGSWSQDGCTFRRSSEAGQLDTCSCNHLTHFAEILVPRTVFSEKNEAALEILTVIGCCLSIIGLLLVGLTALLFRSWRRDYSNKVWLHLCISIFLLCVCFLIMIFAKFGQDDVVCMLTGVVLHYSVLASFCWMLVAAVLSYRRLVTVFSRDTSHKLLKASAFAWGAPCAAIGLLLSIKADSYSGHYDDKSPSGAFCYPSDLAKWLAVYAPIAVMLLANWTLFILIVRSVFCSRREGVRPHMHGHVNEALRCASVSCLLVFLFGLPWLFGLFAFNIVASYCFTILVSFQGLILFLFFVVGNKKTRDLWLNKLKIKQTRKVPVTSSTYTNRSTGVNVPPRGNTAPAAIEANASKPRSLSSSDNSRFS